ncbi:MAG: hypothetical protein KAU20_02905 [Nanoarchaeota archaeon]|nr:hypothetical protein [Nanoarchaeota archaeon]
MQQSVETDKEVTITYETLFELLRNEKNKDELQKLQDSFFEDVINYLKEKQNILNEKKDQENLFEADEKENVASQVKNIKKILKDLYEKREKKIISMALNKSRLKSSIMNLSPMLEEERLFYEMLISLLDSKREEILNNILNCKLPGQKEPAGEKQAEEKQQPAKSNDEDFKSADSIKQEAPKKEVKLVRFTNAVPKFVGKEMEEYGPFDEEDVASLPIEIANLLIEKERAEEIKEG